MPITEAACRSRFSSGGSRSIRAARIVCTVAGTCSASTGRVSRYAPRSPASAPVSTSVRTVSSRKNGLPRFTSICVSGASPGSGAEQRRQQFRRALGGQGVEPELGVGRLAPPAVLVLGAVVHQEQEAGGAKALHEAVEQGLGLAVDPVQVLEDHQQRLHLALPQQQALDRVERALAALRRVQVLPGRVLDRHVEQREQRGQQGLERAVQAQHAPQHLGAHLPVVVPVADLEVALEQVDHRQVAGGLAVGDGRGLQDQPVLDPMRVGELVGEPRLAHPRLAHDGDHLPPAGAGLAEDPAQVLDLGVAAHEAREAAERRGLQPRPRRPRPRQLVDLHGLA